MDAGSRADGATPRDTGRAHDRGPTPDVPVIRGPMRLSETGLYANFARRTLADGIIEYTPRYELWSDGAEKRRYLLLPTGTRIDTSDMDHWVFPVGTRIWKEFRVGARVIETRLVQKMPEGWWMIAYVWNDAGDDAVAAPDGLDEAHGNCGHCHNDQSYFRAESVLRLRLSVNERDQAMTPTYRTSINVPMFHYFDGVNLGVVPGAPERSQLWTRMGRRDAAAMPPVCSLRTDPDGLALVRDWINSLR